jgi:antitoxin VapB
MDTPTSSRKLLPAAKTTTVFTSGNSQAVRLPKEFRVNTKTLEISRRGDEIVLRERPLTVGEVLADLPALSKEEAAEFDVIIKSAKAGLPPVEERDFSWMDEVPARRTKGKVRSSPSKSRIKKRV